VILSDDRSGAYAHIFSSLEWSAPPADYLLESSLIFLLGAVLGSFLNVVIYRWPRGESLTWPGSFCRTCLTSISWWANVPILGWFFVRGRCAHCGHPYSFRYPAVELLTALCSVGLFWRMGLSWSFLETWIMILMLIAGMGIDWDHMILPDELTLGGVVLGLVGAALNPERSFTDAILGVLLGGGFLWAIAYLYIVWRGREGMGGGDIKLLAWVGAVLGYQSVPFVILVASLFGSVGGLAWAALSKSASADQGGSEQVGSGHGDSHWLRPMPFGPFLGGATILYVLFDGKSWVAWYFGLHGF